MTDFSKILDKAKELEKKMKESQERIKKIEVIGNSGGDLVKVKVLDIDARGKIKLSMKEVESSK